MPRYQRTLSILATTALLAAAGSAQARLFLQTYGATVPGPDGGCVWNMGQDYFVPRHCDSGRYDLFSACKSSHYLSPACRKLHPLYCGYCSPYGGCHYKWRDHVYKEHCGCTPTAAYHGPWRLDSCKHKKHGCLACRNSCGPAGLCQSPMSACEAGPTIGGDFRLDGGPGPASCDDQYMYLPNVELIEGATIGTIPVALVGVRSAGGAPTGAASTMPAAPQPAMSLPWMTPLPGAGAGINNSSPWPAGF